MSDYANVLQRINKRLTQDLFGQRLMQNDLRGVWSSTLSLKRSAPTARTLDTNGMRGTCRLASPATSSPSVSASRRRTPLARRPEFLASPTAFSATRSSCVATSKRTGARPTTATSASGTFTWCPSQMTSPPTRSSFPKDYPFKARPTSSNLRPCALAFDDERP
jgi:hypothetical protein